MPEELIERRIFVIRGQKVMLDRDLAKLYGVDNRYLKRQVRRNIDRFPDDFMFVLNKEELEIMVSQFGTPFRSLFGGSKPYAFTEHGILMLSSVLKCRKAIQTNIQIMRVFNKLRQILSTHKELSQKLNELERKVVNHDSDIKGLFEMIHKLLKPSKKSNRRIGFKI